MTRSRLDAVFKEWNPIKCRLEYWKISGRSVNLALRGDCTTPNTDTRTLRGKCYTRSFKGFGIAMKTQVKILLTWIIGHGGIC
ncbi:hypothetical protein HanRHA438_Chr11g0494441 [Helianthus annuus]|nr:hypothetical protein HanRHA438_Chr11g0494441 [Helianthus annuus]